MNAVIDFLNNIFWGQWVLRSVASCSASLCALAARREERM